jgi:hypothetical protein
VYRLPTNVVTTEPTTLGVGAVTGAQPLLVLLREIREQPSNHPMSQRNEIILVYRGMKMCKRSLYRRILNMNACGNGGACGVWSTVFWNFDICMFMPEHSDVVSCLSASQPIRKLLISIYARSVYDTYMNTGTNWLCDIWNAYIILLSTWIFWGAMLCPLV